MKPILRALAFSCLLLAGASPYQIGVFGGAGIYPYEVLQVMVLLGLLLYWLAGRASARVGPIRVSAMELSVMLFWGWVLFGQLYRITVESSDARFSADTGSADELVALKVFGHVLLTIAVLSSAYLSGRYLFGRQGDCRKISWAIVASVFVAALSSVVEWIAATGGTIARYNFVPPTGLGQGDTSQLAQFGLLVALALYLSVRPGFRRLLLVVVLCTIGLCILIIQSRTAYVLTAVEVLLALALALKVRGLRAGVSGKVSIAAVAMVLFGAVSLLVVRTDLAALFDIGSGGAGELDLSNRLAVAAGAWDMFRSQPLMGVGWGRFGLYNDVPMFVSGQAEVVASPHNGVLQLLSETGLVGTVLACAISILMVRAVLRSFLVVSVAEEKLLNAMVLLLLCITVASQAVLSSGLFPPPTQRNTVRLAFYTWFLVGYSVSTARPWRIWGRTSRPASEVTRVRQKLEGDNSSAREEL